MVLFNAVVLVAETRFCYNCDAIGIPTTLTNIMDATFSHLNRAGHGLSAN